jgi:phosphoribosylformylglycinamidine synthase II
MAVGARLTVWSIGPDPRGAELVADARTLGFDWVDDIRPADLFFLDGDLDERGRAELESLLVDPMLQHGTWEHHRAGRGEDRGAHRAATVHVVETSLLPGVTDTVADVLQHAALTLGVDLRRAATGRRFEVVTHDDVAGDEVQRLATRLLANEIVERAAVGLIDPPFAHQHSYDGTGLVEVVPVRGADDAGLSALNQARGLALDPAELRVIADYFASIGRDPTDVELEMLAQTWSEHCAHKSFRADVELPDGSVATPLLARLREATDHIAAPFVRSAFVGNAGIVSFVPDVTVAVKAETHNHPSAIEPFGGANTGVGGVIRDVLGAAHLPCAVTDVLCFGPTDLPSERLPPGVIHPRMVREGVVAGIADYGNKIGLPTVAGAVLFDAGYTANPLVFAGCVGLARAGDAAPVLDGPHPGDLVVVLGGRTGRDGLRGATFSSATMDATTGDVAGASVQIGDPITEKLLIDLLREAAGSYTAITDCGAGGLSSAVGEMAESTGAIVELGAVPLKYAGLAPWEIWLSEAQERMVVAVDPDQLATLGAHADRCGVEVSVIGRFTGDRRLIVRAGDQVVADLDTQFLHEGRPRRRLAAVPPAPHRNGAVPVVDDPAAALLALLAHPNIGSKESVIRRYDHEIGGATVVRPVVGIERDAPADGVVLAEPGTTTGLAIGIGVNPWYGTVDPERMARAVVDEALRNVVAVGADPDKVVLMDNFSWGDPRRPTTFGALVAAVDGCVASSLEHSAPFVSGKDSLNNEYLGSDGERHSVPPTLVIHAIAHIPDADRVVTPDLKAAGNSLVLIGVTDAEFGGSHLGMVLGGFDDPLDGTAPAVDPRAPARFRRLHRLLVSGAVAACHDVSEGGLAVALAEMAIGGRLGLRVDHVPHGDPTVAWFAESTGRFVCEVPADRAARFVREFTDAGDHAVVVGMVTEHPVLDFGAWSVPLDAAVGAFTGGPRR